MHGNLDARLLPTEAEQRAEDAAHELLSLTCQTRCKKCRLIAGRAALASSEKVMAEQAARIARLARALEEYMFAEELDDTGERQGELAIARHHARAALNEDKPHD